MKAFNRVTKLEYIASRLAPHHRNPKKEHIVWRRERVAELSAQGRTEREIATVLKVALGTVSNDLSYLNKQAETEIKEIDGKTWLVIYDIFWDWKEGEGDWKEDGPNPF